MIGMSAETGWQHKNKILHCVSVSARVRSLGYSAGNRANNAAHRVAVLEHAEPNQLEHDPRSLVIDLGFVFCVLDYIVIRTSNQIF